MTVLRLEADDPAVLEFTGLALHDSVDIPDPPRLLCKSCQRKLGAAGDTAHGPLFVSSWEYEPPLSHSVTVNGRRLSRRAAIRWREEHDELVERRGEPLHKPLEHGVTALLLLPAELAQDYPDLLVRCDKHGDTVLDRAQVIGWLRQAALKPFRMKVAVSKLFSEYRDPRPTPGPSGGSHQLEVWRVRFDAMSVDEYERRRHQHGADS